MRQTVKRFKCRSFPCHLILKNIPGCLKKSEAPSGIETSGRRLFRAVTCFSAPPTRTCCRGPSPPCSKRTFARRLRRSSSLLLFFGNRSSGKRQMFNFKNDKSSLFLFFRWVDAHLTFLPVLRETFVFLMNDNDVSPPSSSSFWSTWAAFCRFNKNIEVLLLANPLSAKIQIPPAHNNTFTAAHNIYRSYYNSVVSLWHYWPRLYKEAINKKTNDADV